MPFRDSEIEAAADLVRARELPRHGIAFLLSGLTAPLAAQPMNCSNVAAGSHGEAVLFRERIFLADLPNVPTVKHRERLWPASVVHMFPVS